MRKNRLIALLLALVLSAGLLAACGAPTADPAAPSDTTEPADTSAPADTSEPEKAPSDTIKIGLVNPTTGPLAGFGEGTPWAEELVVDYVNNELGGIYFEDYDASLPIELIVYDSQSDTTICSEMAQKLVEEDDVDIIIARHTPDTVNPVNAIAERYGVFCVSIDAPVDAWAAEGEHYYSQHSHFTVGNIVDVYTDIWANMGYPASSDTKIGYFFPNDADGTVWAAKFTEALEGTEYTIVDPGRFPTSTTNFSDMIKLFQDEGVEIIMGVATCPVFASFWLQCSQMGYKPPVVGVGKAYLLEADALSIGAELMDGLCTEVWWTRWHPWQSSLTGWTPEDLATAYETEVGRSITQPIGYKYASLEICVDILQASTSLDIDDLMAAREGISMDTIIGTITYDKVWEENGSKYGLTPVCGGQWQLQDDGSLELVITGNSLYPQVPITGEYIK